MSNFAALIAPLSISGSRLSDGSPNASGKVWFFQPGGNTPVNVYTDAEATAVVTQPVTLTDGGLVSTADYPDGIFATQPVRIYIEDSDAEEVSDTIYIPATAGNVGVDNDGWTATTLDEVLTALTTSTGGTDGTYLESAGATARTIRAKFAEIQISVKDFDAVGDGVAIDTTAIQNAMNRVKALGGGVLWFPSGTYKIDQALTLSSAAGVTIRGAGAGASTISSTNTSANCFTFTSCASLRISGITIAHATESTGDALSLTTCASPAFDDVVHEGASNSGFRRALVLDGCSGAIVTDCTLEGEASNAAARGILADDSGALTVIGGRLEGVTGYAFEADGNTGSCVFIGVTFATTARFAATLTGTVFTFVSCYSLVLSVATATIPGIRLVASAPFSSSASAATGGSVTPVLTAGNIFTATGTASGAGTITVNDPAVFPASAAGQFWDFILVNTTGNNVTWAFGAAYRLNGAVTNTTGQTTMIRFYCDGTTIRESAFRAVTTT